MTNQLNQLPSVAIDQPLKTAHHRVPRVALVAALVAMSKVAPRHGDGQRWALST